MRFLKSPATRSLVAALLAAALAASGARAGTVRGTVRNGTTGKAAPGVEVVLIQLQGTMQPVATTKSDAQGQFSFDHAGIGAQPMLVRAVYHGVNFHQPLPPGRAEVEVQVFDATADPKTITVPSRVVIFQPNGSSLIVGEEYSVQNDARPPQAYFRADGNFEFSLPDHAKLQQVAAWGPSGMPVVQADLDRGKNRHAVAFAFRPGESGVRYSYQLPYPGDQATVKLPVSYPGSLLFVAPPTMEIKGPGISSRGQEQGMSVYSAENASPGQFVTVSVSGTAPPPAQANDGADPGSGNSRTEGNVAVQTTPPRLDAVKWPLLGVLLAMFVFGAVLLARKPVVAGAGLPAPGAPTAGQASRPGPAESAMADLDSATSASLDSLKERIFRLELRHQAGTITEEEYREERARTEKILRDLVRG